MRFFAFDWSLFVLFLKLFLIWELTKQVGSFFQQPNFCRCTCAKAKQRSRFLWRGLSTSLEHSARCECGLGLYFSKRGSTSGLALYVVTSPSHCLCLKYYIDTCNVYNCNREVLSHVYLLISSCLCLWILLAFVKFVTAPFILAAVKSQSITLLLVPLKFCRL